MNKLTQYIGLFAASMVAISGCGGATNRAQESVAVAGNRSVLSVDSPVMPAVDSRGTAWFLPSRPADGGVYMVTAADRSGWSSTVEFDVGGEVAASPVVATGPDGMVVAATACLDDACDETELVVGTLRRAGDEIELVGDVWRSVRSPEDARNSLRAVNASDQVGAIQDGSRVALIRSGQDPEPVALPEGGGSPCVTGDGRLLAVQMVASTALRSGQAEALGAGAEADPDVTAEIVEYSDGSWRTIAGSSRAWNTLYRAGGEFGCSPHGIHYAEEAQPARSLWTNEWNEFTPRLISWRLSAAASPRGLVGISDESVVRIDAISGETDLSVPLPSELSDQIHEPQRDQESEVNVLGGWIAIGGQSDSPTALVCLSPTASTTGQEVACRIFSM